MILGSGAVEFSALPPRAHIIQAVATFATFLRNWSVSKVLETATWRSNLVFKCFCIRLTRVVRWGPLSQGV